jgi:hypothetical protein
LKPEITFFGAAISVHGLTLDGNLKLPEMIDSAGRN